MESFHIYPKENNVQEIAAVLNGECKLVLSDQAKERIVKCREYLDRKMEGVKEPIYGITTGFGSLYNVSIEQDQLSQLQANLVMSHACGEIGRAHV